MTSKELLSYAYYEIKRIKTPLAIVVFLYLLPWAFGLNITNERFLVVRYKLLVASVALIFSYWVWSEMFPYIQMSRLLADETGLKYGGTIVARAILMGSIVLGVLLGL